MSGTPFLVFALPRSRTLWLSQLLSHAGYHCGHEQARYMRSLDDVKSWLAQDFTGSVETTAAYGWRLVREIRPDLRVLVVRRPVEEVHESLMRFGLDAALVTRRLMALDRRLDQIEAGWPGMMSVAASSLDFWDTGGEVYRHCLGADPWEMPSPKPVSGDLSMFFRYGSAHAKQLAHFTGVMKREIINHLHRDRKPAPIAGITFQEETLDVFMRDGQELFADHCLSVGEPPDEWRRKNIPYLEKISAAGLAQIVTARCNGRMFGYLTAGLAPSAENTTTYTAVQTLFYARPDVWGLGMLLQQAAIDGLKRRGGRWEIFQREGVRGAGPKMGSLYRHMGSEEFGKLYKLTVEA